MLSALFSWLNTAVNSSPLIAIAGAFLWGVLSILLSPCHLTSIPLIVGFISGQGNTLTRRAFILSLLFALGILLTIAAIGIITALLGRMLGDIGPYANYFLAAIFVLVGLYLLEIISLPGLSGSDQRAFKRRGAFTALILGLLFGIALGPCTFAYMAPMLGVVFKLGASRFIFSLLLLLFYAFGHCSVIVGAGTLTELVERYLNWHTRSRGLVVIKKICGVLVILGGLYLIWTA